ncbi:hypothetical protein AB2B41_12935 [Marimonas sp. MJW-29]|uniref:Capsular polysaccharide biosynthesis protein n=1 Tax=Sulfitobacter sediminis TaxID=3234186 RepID=A0ABV3RNG7_9RHOB
MAEDATVHFYLEEPFRTSAARGEHNFINLVAYVLKAAGLHPVFEDLPIRGEPTTGFSLSHMVNPPNDRGLVFRRVYHYPFWQIEAVAQRWHWDVARATFDPDTASRDAPRFYSFWQKRLFGDAPNQAGRDGFVYVPLQGRLTEERLFQACSPMEMIEHCLALNPRRQIVATLHPNESYTRRELGQLETLARRHDRLRLDTGNMVSHLKGCDFVVTQNSGAAFSGFFFGKPALLFGQIDFHHIAVRADMDALGASFDEIARAAPPFDKYVWWFWQDQSINAGRDDARAKIADRLRRFGWPIP